MSTEVIAAGSSPETESWPAIRKLGTRFRLTEVHLWGERKAAADSVTRIRKSRHIYFRDDDEVEDETLETSEISETAYDDRHATKILEYCSLAEDSELTRLMNSMGLPISFSTSKENKITAKKKKGKRAISEPVDQSNDCNINISSDVNERNYESNSAVNDVCATATSRMRDNNFNAENNLHIDAVIEADNHAMSGGCKGLQDELVETYFSSNMEYGAWTVYWDTFYERYYFYNVHTLESTWYPPPGLENFVLFGSGCAYIEDALTLQDTLAVTHDGHQFADRPPEIIAPIAKVTDYSMHEVDQFETYALDVHGEEKESHVHGKGFSNGVPAGNGDEGLFNTYDFRPGVSVAESSVPIDDVLENEDSKNICSTSDALDFQQVQSWRKQRGRRSSQVTFKGVPGSLCAENMKYWCQRYLLFSLFDEGIKMDEEGWFSVTPEPVARHHASRCSGGTIVDCFAGVGGNSIQFAMKCNHVVSVDIDPQKIEYAQHNATIYGVNDHIDFVLCDFMKLPPNLKGDTVFMSPPWGGPDYVKVQSYDLETMLKPCNGSTLLKIGAKIAPRVVIFLPRNVDINQLAELCLSVEPYWSVEVEKNFLNGKLKAITAYFDTQKL